MQASRKILIEQNIKKQTGPALCVLCGFSLHKGISGKAVAGSVVVKTLRVQDHLDMKDQRGTVVCNDSNNE
jgi:hypothetical protein